MLEPETFKVVQQISYKQLKSFGNSAGRLMDVKRGRRKYGIVLREKEIERECVCVLKKSGTRGVKKKGNDRW